MTAGGCCEGPVPRQRQGRPQARGDQGRPNQGRRGEVEAADQQTLILFCPSHGGAALEQGCYQGV
jgi:hypothetical protein